MVLVGNSKKLPKTSIMGQKAAISEISSDLTEINSFLQNIQMGQILLSQVFPTK